MDTLRRIAARLFLACVYGFTWCVAALGQKLPHRSWKPNGRILLTGAFHNPNWYLSHVTPLTRSGMTEIIVVTDEPQSFLKHVRTVCPSQWARRLLGRVLARSVWVIIAGVRYRPDLYMGYHITPAACSALVAGKLLGRPSCYQMTGGPVEIIGGGFEAVESAGGRLGRPSKGIESMILAIVKLFDLVVVRGRKAEQFLVDHNVGNSTAIITGSVSNSRTERDREIDLVFVGRLSPMKQVTHFIAVVKMIVKAMPAVRAVIIGDGPLMETMKVRVNELGLATNVEFLGKRNDVQSILASCRLFLLTSKSEGLSIAMAEAMSVGTVPVVADVGELSDLVIDGVNGYLVEPGNIAEYAEKVLSLLQDDARWSQYSSKAIEAARIRCDINVVSKKWGQHLHDVIRRAPRCRWQETAS